eukprot:12228-Prymnesium_polylepis.1
MPGMRFSARRGRSARIDRMTESVVRARAKASDKSVVTSGKVRRAHEHGMVLSTLHTKWLLGTHATGSMVRGARHTVAKRRDEARQPRERDDEKVELAPRVAQHLDEQLEGEDVEVDVVAAVDERLLGRARRVERRVPRHGRAVGHDGEQDQT